MRPWTPSGPRIEGHSILRRPNRGKIGRKRMDINNRSRRGTCLQQQCHHDRRGNGYRSNHEVRTLSELVQVWLPIPASITTCSCADSSPLASTTHRDCRPNSTRLVAELASSGACRHSSVPGYRRRDLPGREGRRESNPLREGPRHERIPSALSTLKHWWPSPRAASPKGPPGLTPWRSPQSRRPWRPPGWSRSRSWPRRQF